MLSIRQPPLKFMEQKTQLKELLPFSFEHWFYVQDCIKYRSALLWKKWCVSSQSRHGTASPEAVIDKGLKRPKMYFLLLWRLAGAWENSFVVLFFIRAHTDLASAMWRGKSQKLWEEALLGEYEVVVLGWVAVRRLAIVTSFVVGISCGSVIVGQIEVINHNPPFYCGLISAPKAPESWTSAHCLPPPPPSSVLCPFALLSW